MIAFQPQSLETSMKQYSETLWTYQDYVDIPWDGKSYQIIKGVLYMVPIPTSNHQQVLMNLSE